MILQCSPEFSIIKYGSVGLSVVLNGSFGFFRVLFGFQLSSLYIMSRSFYGFKGCSTDTQRYL